MLLFWKRNVLSTRLTAAMPPRKARQEVEAITARIAQRTQTYARTRMAAAIVARVMQTYREQHQGPVLGRAGELFARLTRGRFSSLAVDYQDDCQILLGQQPDGGRLGVSGLSQGTRHQLFLALRLAAIEEHLREREAVPIIIDDLLVQFDDARATATLEVLAELACQTQVLFFTHHRHLCELAATTLPAGCLATPRIGPVLEGQANRAVRQRIPERLSKNPSPAGGERGRDDCVSTL